MSDTSHIGLIHNKDLPKDAIHIAIAQVRAGEELKAGDRVGFKEGESIVYKDTNSIGIVDPFIEEKITKDCLFYLFLFPNTVSSLVHLWEHPLFNRTPERIAAAEAWLKNKMDWWQNDSDPHDMGYNNYERVIRDFKDGDLGYYMGGDDFSDMYNSNENGTFRKQFWDNLEIVTGKLATKEQRAQEYFTCSC